MQLGKVDLNKLRGLGDKFVGLGKELVGTLVGNERLEQEGESQQARASEELRAMRSEARAQAEEAKAEGLDEKQRAAQRDKETTA
ncbi:MAG: hypothetical protein M3N68_06870 [Actinomycetota bacterium]|nr:hypothetical protein [Actinomycetota bacterium]